MTLIGTGIVLCRQFFDVTTVKERIEYKIALKNLIRCRFLYYSNQYSRRNPRKIFTKYSEHLCNFYGGAPFTPIEQSSMIKILWKSYDETNPVSRLYVEI